MTISSEAASEPTLGSFGVPATTADPKLEVFPADATVPILSNDNWNDNPDAAYTAQIAQTVQSFAPTNASKDAAFVITLPPGGYTVVGSGAIANAAARDESQLSSFHKE